MLLSIETVQLYSKSFRKMKGISERMIREVACNCMNPGLCLGRRSSREAAMLAENVASGSRCLSAHMNMPRYAKPEGSKRLSFEKARFG
jgi:hypothetical protein